MSTHGSNKIPATLIPGDGIGPEIVAAVIEVLDALGAPFVVGASTGRHGWDRSRRRSAAAGDARQHPPQ